MNAPRRQSPEAWASQLNFAGIERQHGLPAGILTRLVRQESGGNCDAVSPAGARGLCQFMPGTARQMGVDASDPVSSVNGAARYLEDLMDMFGGDVDKAVAAYNWGPGNMRRAVRQHGDNWRSALPAETRHYLQVVGGGARSYAQRRQAGETIPAEEEEAEITRRNNRLAEAGLPPMDLKDLLGSLFFAAIASFIQSKVEETERASPETYSQRNPAPTTDESPHISNRDVPSPAPTPPAPRQIAASRSNAPVPA